MVTTGTAPRMLFDRPGVVVLLTHTVHRDALADPEGRVNTTVEEILRLSALVVSAWCATPTRTSRWAA